jgi:hypothetical protein
MKTCAVRIDEFIDPLKEAETKSSERRYLIDHLTDFCFFTKAFVHEEDKVPAFFFLDNNETVEQPENGAQRDLSREKGGCRIFEIVRLIDDEPLVRGKYRIPGPYEACISEQIVMIRDDNVGRDASPC